MQALPYLQLRESESPTSSAKINYRLSRHETAAKTACQDDGQTRDGKSVNRPDYLVESPTQFEGRSSIVFGNAPNFHTPLPSPTPSKVLKQAPKIPIESCHPEWVESLGVWLTNRRKCNSYVKFTRHVKLLRRTSDMFLDPSPHVPRCSHERTLSALRRQRQRFKTEEELRIEERQIRIIEKVQQFRELWEQWTRKTKPVGKEHKKRLNNFKKSRDGYTDPEGIIRKKREERIQREKVIRLESERRREEWLRKKRFRLPKIIVTYYEEDEEEEEKSTLSRRGSNLGEERIKLPKLASILSSEKDKGDVVDENSQECKGNRLEIPEVERYCPEDFCEVIKSAQHEGETEGVLYDSETKLEAGIGGDSQENGVVDENQNTCTALECNNQEENDINLGDKLLDVRDDEAVMDKHSNCLNEDFENETENVNVVGCGLSEEEHENYVEAVVHSGEASESGDSNPKKNETTNSNKPGVLQTEEGDRDTLERPEEQYIADDESVTKSLEVNESKRGVQTEEITDRNKTNEYEINYLLPPSLKGLAAENGSDGSVINEADDTASLMAALIPIAMGVGNGIIPNDAIRASTVYDRYHVPSQARLNNAKKGKYAGAWRPKINDKKQYLEVDLGAVSRVTQVSTQGYPTVSGAKVNKKDKCWVESYTLDFSTDGSQWQQYTENGVVKVFKGNRDNNSVIINSIANPVEAKFVRFMPQSWKNSIALRVEVYGEVTEPDLTVLTPRTSSLATESVDEPVHEVILEEDEEGEEVEQSVCYVEEEVDQQDAWEENTVDAVTETSIQFENQVPEVSGSPSVITELTVHGEKQIPRSKRKSKKLQKDKPEEKERKKKRKNKKGKEEKRRASLSTSLTELQEAEEERTSSPEEGEQEEEEDEEEEETPILPEIPKRPESVKRMASDRKRSFNMFPDRKDNSEEKSKPRRRRAESDQSVRNELLRQQIAEDRRKKLAAATEKTKREIQSLNSVYDIDRDNNSMDDFLTKYCILSERQINYYRRVFENYDQNQDGYLFPEEVLEALESVNSNLLPDSHINYIYRVMELCDCSLDSGADFKLFSVVAAFSQRLAVLDEFAKILILKLNFKELDIKLQKAKRLFLCYVDEAKKTISLEDLILGLTAGGLTVDQREQTLKVLGRTAALDFLDFLTYIPLFIHIHDHILQDPLGTVVYRDLLTV